MLIVGRCHCGNISFVLDWKSDPSTIPARACTCSFCTKHGGVWTSNPNSSLKVTFKNSQHVSCYAFGTKTAQFRICAECGVAPLATSLIDDRLYAVVNVNAFENIDPALLQRASTNLDGEDCEDRLARRKRNWIADVTITEENP